MGNKLRISTLEHFHPHMGARELQILYVNLTVPPTVPYGFVTDNVAPADTNTEMHDALLAYQNADYDTAISIFIRTGLVDLSTRVKLMKYKGRAEYINRVMKLDNISSYNAFFILYYNICDKDDRQKYFNVAQKEHSLLTSLHDKLLDDWNAFR